MNKKFIQCAFTLKALGTSAEGSVGTFEGYGSVFGNRDSYADIVLPGAFAKSLTDYGMPVLLWQHQVDNPIGIYTAAFEDSHGLYVKGELNLETQQGREAYSLLKQGAIKGLSIGYSETETERAPADTSIKYIKEVRLYEVSLVTFPANPLANVESVKNQPQTIRDFEKLLRDAGVSREKAKTLLASGYKAAFPCDAGNDVDVESVVINQIRSFENGITSTIERAINQAGG